MSSLYSKITAALFPRRCPVCGKITDSATPRLCHECAEALAVEYEKHCPVCNGKASVCTCHPEAQATHDSSVIALGFYEPGQTNSLTSRLVYALKHQTDDTAAHILARDLAGAILKDFLARDEDVRTWVITYAPRSILGYEENGFDQAQRLAKLCARYVGARYERIFCRHGGDTQKELSEKERQINAAASIRLRHKRRKYSGKYIVVDDILTTGATLAECAGLLISRGAESVRIAVPYRTLPRRPKQTLWYAAAGKNSQ